MHKLVKCRHLISFVLLLFPPKGIVTLIWSDPPIKKGHTRITKVHIKPRAGHVPTF